MTRLKHTLSESERRDTAKRLWKIIDLIDEGASRSTLREAVKFTVEDIQPFCSEYEEEAA